LIVSLLLCCSFVTLSFDSLMSRPVLHSFPTRRSSDLLGLFWARGVAPTSRLLLPSRWRPPVRHGAVLPDDAVPSPRPRGAGVWRSEEHTSELQSRENLVCRLLLEKKKKQINNSTYSNN